jgi:hypothetical protein
MTRRERNAKDPEAGDVGKPLGCFQRHQRQNRRRNFDPWIVPKTATGIVVSIG